MVLTLIECRNHRPKDTGRAKASLKGREGFWCLGPQHSGARATLRAQTFLFSLADTDFTSLLGSAPALPMPKLPSMQSYTLGCAGSGFATVLLPLEARRPEEGLREGRLFGTAESGAGHSVGHSVHTLQKTQLLSAAWKKPGAKGHRL